MKHAQASQFPQQFSPALQAIHHGELVIGNKLNLREKETHLACPNTKKEEEEAWGSHLQANMHIAKGLEEPYRTIANEYFQK